MSEIAKLLWLRYPAGVIAEDEAQRSLGCARLRALLDHIVQTGDGEKLRRAVSGWTPWLPTVEADHLLEQCAALRQTWDAGELGMLFDLSLEERAALKITTIRPAGYGDDDMARLRRASKAEAERRRRYRISAEERHASRAVVDDGAIGERRKVVFAQTSSTDWRSSSSIAAALAQWPEFEGLDPSSVRKAVTRSCGWLVKAGLLQSEIRKGIRRESILFVRRTGCAFPGVHAGFVSETPGHSTSAAQSEKRDIPHG